ncbi:hypothetical protein PN498_13745 [Oscillatoria sp. CS-180]|uniref:hypothetical protein n=1 Tax=Oscillatoria sp. CS-180 TaxID=3021720 RepID=UPI0023308D3F|nr:hypothetical protein [Oscillatoria sp. CS-180]MDB9527059.1 hypothetical protein [Oscillatoria sp. CS-180]
MRTTTTLNCDHSAYQRHLREMVKRLVIELGYLEHCLEKGLQDTHVQAAATGIDTAIDCLNEHLSTPSI